MQKRRKKAFHVLQKISLGIFLQGLSLLCFASDYVPPMRTGRGALRLNAKELSEKLNQLSLFEKHAIALVQLETLLPPVFLENIPLSVLEKSNFSCSDDEWARASKFSKLALNLQDFPESKEKHILMALAYASAASHLESASYISPFRKWDYYLSMAQYKSWAARNMFICENYTVAFQLLEDVEYYFDEAERSLGSVQSFDLKLFKHFVDSFIDDLSEEELKDMADDALTRMQVWSQEDIDAQIFDEASRKMDKQRGRVRALPVSEKIKDMTLENYRKIQIEKLSRRMTVNSYEEKLSIIKSQNSLVNYYKLIGMHRIPDELHVQLETSGYLDYVEFDSLYRHLENSGMDVKTVIRNKIVSERARFQTFLETLRSLNF